MEVKKKMLGTQILQILRIGSWAFFLFGGGSIFEVPLILFPEKYSIFMRECFPGYANSRRNIENNTLYVVGETFEQPLLIAENLDCIGHKAPKNIQRLMGKIISSSWFREPDENNHVNCSIRVFTQKSIKISYRVLWKQIYFYSYRQIEKRYKL